jgi:LmbE family N-acetylglucosaminyl deacetylase
MTPLFPPLDLRRLLVVSPHFDDAVLGSAHLLDAATEAMVVTVFGGRTPRTSARVTSWDRRCGFTPDDDVVAIRREENAQALGELGVEACDLHLVDRQYRPRRYRPDDVASALAPVVAGWRPTNVALPLGIGHSDHWLAAEGALRLTDGDGSERIAYTELPYGWRTPDLVVQRLARLRTRYDMLPAPQAPRPAAKAKAVACYSSQLRALGLTCELDEFASQPEQLWMVSPRPQHLHRLRRLAALVLVHRGMGGRRRTPADGVNGVIA